MIFVTTFGPEDGWEGDLERDVDNEPERYARWRAEHERAGYRVREADPLTRHHLRVAYATHPASDETNAYYAFIARPARSHR